MFWVWQVRMEASLGTDNHIFSLGHSVMYSRCGGESSTAIHIWMQT